MVPGLTTLERLMGSIRLYWAILDWDKVVSLETCFIKYMISWGS